MVGSEHTFRTTSLGVLSHGNVSWPGDPGVDSHGLVAPIVAYTDNPDLMPILGELGFAAVQAANFTVDWAAGPVIGWRSSIDEVIMEFAEVPDGGGTMSPTIWHRPLPGADHPWFKSTSTASFDASWTSTITVLNGTGPVGAAADWAGGTTIPLKGFAANDAALVWERM